MQGPDQDATTTSGAKATLEVSDDQTSRAARTGRDGGLVRVLKRIVSGIERLAATTGKASWVLVWVIFALGLFNVTTRYIARFIQRDIIVGQMFDLQWMLFGTLVLLGLNYGVSTGVNPRIDFWWVNYSTRTKAVIDLVFHGLMFLPFLVMGIRLLWPWTMTGLGRSLDGTWSTWKVWQIWEQSTDAGGLGRGPIKVMLLLGFGLMATQIIAEIIKQILILAGHEEIAPAPVPSQPLRVE